MTKKSTFQIDAEIQGQLPTNGAQLITATRLRGVLDTILDSFSQQNVVQITASPYTVLDANYQNLHVINRGTPTNITLPAPGAIPTEFLAGWSALFENIGAGTSTLIPAGGRLINGAASIALPTGFSAIVSSDGTDYWAILVNGTGAGANTASILFIMDGGGSPITPGVKADIPIPFNCTINDNTMLADQVGSAVVDIWKDTFANYPPTVADSITAAAKPTIAAANKSQDTTLTGWTTVINAGDILRINVDSAATITRLTLALKVTR